MSYQLKCKGDANHLRLICGVSSEWAQSIVEGTVKETIILRYIIEKDTDALGDL